MSSPQFSRLPVVRFRLASMSCRWHARKHSLLFLLRTAASIVGLPVVIAPVLKRRYFRENSGPAPRAPRRFTFDIDLNR